MSVIDDFDRTAQIRPDHPCLRWAGGQLSYAEVQRQSRRVAAGLQAAGFAPGAKGAVLSPNDAHAFICVLGLMRAGLVWLPLNPRNSSEENAHTLAAFDCDVLFFHSDFEPDLPLLCEPASRIRLLLRIDEAPNATTADIESLAPWAARHPDRFEPLVLPPDHLAAICATGGTTGRSKGVMHTVASFLALTTAHSELHARDTEPVFLSAAPMTHAGGRMCLSILRQGGTIVVLPRVESGAVLRAIAEYRVTRTYLPPTAIYSLLAREDVRDYDYASLVYFIYGGSPMSVTKLREAIAVFGPVMSAGYGQTEAPMAVTQLSPEDHFVDGQLGGTVASDARLASCGRPTPFIDLRIMDEHGQPLAQGMPGEIVVRGDLLMSGYYKDPETSREAARFGWHHTGDIGYLDAEGFLHLVDRKKEMIITGGFNVYPSEVEQVILSLPEVQDCAVVGVPDEKWGEAIKAVVQLLPGHHLAPEDIIAACRPRLGGVKTPKSIEIWADLPRSPVGKVLRRVVREHFWNSLERRI